jgi:predicted ATP-binding protein involved in virulence
MTVIHGANGVGKTVFLKLTYAFLRARFFEVFNTPFQAFEIRYSDRSAFRITASHLLPGEKRELQLAYTRDGQNWSAPKTVSSRKLNQFNKRIGETAPYLIQIEPDLWMDQRNEEVLSSEEALARADEFNPRLGDRMERENKDAFDFCRRINVHYIEAQRLFCFSKSASRRGFTGTPYMAELSRHMAELSRPTSNTVQEYSDELKSELERALASYARHSQDLDQSFPRRLLKEGENALPIDSLKYELEEIERERDRLKKLGILDGGEPIQSMPSEVVQQLDNLQEQQRPVMSVYVRDTKEKLGVLKELSDKVDVLLSILNKKFSKKQVSVSRQNGLVIQDENGGSIPVAALSSGEQHEIVLLYALLFKVKPNSLVLIDEPELSLHLEWQKSFMDDMLRIIELSKFDILMATHSPYIVGDHAETLVEFSVTA